MNKVNDITEVPIPAKASCIDIRYVSRAISSVENRGPESAALLRKAWSCQHTVPVPVVGVTGPPGAGKSTLLDKLALHWAEAGLRVALIPVDPSSPFTGGALLGDRFRMDLASSHPNVFVRSLGSRGHVGGLSRAVQDVTVLLGSLNFDLVVIETVGSGQSDIEIAQLADCVVVVSVPGLGDQIQAAKAGILEIGDVYAVNKSDTPGAETVAAHLQANLDLVYPGSGGVNQTARDPSRFHGTLPANEGLHARHGRAISDTSFWRPPVLSVSASKGEGVEELGQVIDSFLAWQNETGHDVTRRSERLRSHLVRLATAQLLEEIGVDPSLPQLVQAVTAGNCMPEDAAKLLITALRHGIDAKVN